METCASYLHFMISVLIPFYNWDISGLLEDVLTAATAVDLAIEIIACDDHSEDISLFEKLKTRNQGVQHVRLFRNETNLGRAATRNALVIQAAYECIVFIDGDSRLMTPKKYLAEYLSAFDRTTVLFGGTKYESRAPSERKYRLHWNYGRKRESRKASNRNESPLRFVFSNNFCCSRELLMQIPFDETLVGYGYEDSFWGNQIANAGFHIKHIDNYVIHKGLNNSTQFLKNADQAILTLAENNAEEKSGHIALLRYHNKLSQSIYGKILLSLAGNLNALTRLVLHKGFVSNVLTFDFYRLGRLNRTLKKLLLDNR